MFCDISLEESGSVLYFAEIVSTPAECPLSAVATTISLAYSESKHL
jgi:hypothetical protein